MNEREKKKGTRVLRFFWGFFPWLIVIGILAFVIRTGTMIGEKGRRLEEAKKAAIKNEDPPVKVITLTLKPKRIEDKISLPGTVEPYENLWVKAEVPGQVVKVLVSEGQLVSKGQVLVELDDRDYRTRLERIEANCQLATLDHERISRLTKNRIAAVTDLEKVDARLKDLNSQLEEARLALSRTRIKAPISGRLNEITAKIGDWMMMDKPVAQILQYDKVKVTVGIPESDVAAVFDLNEAEVIIEALGKRTFTGKKIFLSRQPRTLAKLYDLDLVVQNPEGRILPGMFARAVIVKKVFRGAISIPLYSIITRGDDSFVYIEKNRVAEKRPVKLGILTGWQVQVTSGLETGDRVIIVGHRLLDGGQNVEVIKNVSDPGEILES